MALRQLTRKSQTERMLEQVATRIRRRARDRAAALMATTNWYNMKFFTRSRVSMRWAAANYVSLFSKQFRRLETHKFFCIVSSETSMIISIWKNLNSTKQQKNKVKAGTDREVFVRLSRERLCTSQTKEKQRLKCEKIPKTKFQVNWP
jgi:hypothetical protein